MFIFNPFLCGNNLESVLKEDFEPRLHLIVQRYVEPRVLLGREKVAHEHLVNVLILYRLQVLLIGLRLLL